MGVIRARPLEAGAAQRPARGPGRVIVALLALASGTLAGLSLAAHAGAAPAFKIDLKGAALTPLSPHAAEGGDPIHEFVTDAAILSVTPHASSILILNIQRGVQNTDVTHQWDSEYHFDNASVGVGVGFAESFAAIRGRLAAAKKHATGNPEFLDPTYTSFHEIATELEDTLRRMAKDRECRIAGDCVRAFKELADRVKDVQKNAAVGVNLERNPFPDPHLPTANNSPFAKVSGGRGCGYCGVFSRINLGYVEIVFELGNVSKRANTLFRNLISADNPLRRKLEKLRRAVRAYLAFQDLGHAFHATQDFFAHTNYVELQAGVPVGTPIPAATVIPLPTDFAQFSLEGLKPLLARQPVPQDSTATLYDELESGAVLTSWLGEGDFCAGTFFNPARGSIRVKLPVAVVLPGGGKNTDPPAKFTFCHYHTKTNVGLNKDEPPAKDPEKNEPSYANHKVALKAALQMSILLWRSFLASIGERCPQGESSCPAPEEPTDVWGGSWELTVEGAEWAPGQSTACCLVLTRISEEQGRPLVGQTFGDRTFGPCPEFTTFYTGQVAFGAGGDVRACTQVSGFATLHAVFKTTFAKEAPLPQQYTPLQAGATLELLVRQQGVVVGTWTPQTLSLNLTGRCVSGKCLPVATP